MSRILFFLGLMTLAMRVVAQNQNPDMPCSITFSPLDNSPQDPAMWGEADYYRVLNPPWYLPGYPTFTNLLDVYISASAPPQDAWLLEKETDGTFKPIAEITNLDDQFFTLTTTQIHKLVEGSLYADVDYGDSNYLGNLAPQYRFANGPTVIMDIPQPNSQNVADGYTVISPNNRDAKFVFDGSHCVDPFYLPMQFSWTGWAGYFVEGEPIFTNSGVLATHNFKVGGYIISLQARDSVAESNPFYFYLTVITAGQAVNSIISDIQSLNSPQKTVLTRVLSNAAADFDNGRIMDGCIVLDEFKILVKTMHLGSTATTFLTQSAQDIIDATSSGANMR